MSDRKRNVLVCATIGCNTLLAAGYLWLYVADGGLFNLSLAIIWSSILFLNVAKHFQE